jgi:hypothetical protein
MLESTRSDLEISERRLCRALRTLSRVEVEEVERFLRTVENAECAVTDWQNEVNRLCYPGQGGGTISMMAVNPLMSGTELSND